MKKATKVHVRSKPISKGRSSLYLDFWPAILDPATQKLTRRHFLGIYVADRPRTPAEKEAEREAYRDAEAIAEEYRRALRRDEFQLMGRQVSDGDFLEYIRAEANKRHKSNRDNWLSALRQLEKYSGGRLPFRALNIRYCDDFRSWLLQQAADPNVKRFSHNTAAAYFSKITEALRKAFRQGMLLEDLSPKIKPITPRETNRPFLTLEEAMVLYETPYKDDILRRAALFSLSTGLRFSDVQNLKWANVSHAPSTGNRISFTQKKTGAPEFMPINEEAAELLGERKKPEERVFPGLTYSIEISRKLRAWCRDAGIEKPITFHCFRHSFATLQHQAGTDLYTIGRLLGQRGSRSAITYTRVTDPVKEAASKRIKLKSQES
jgi:integrase